MNISLHRAGVAVATVAVSAGLALTPTAAQAATSPQASAGTAWLASQLPDDALVQNFGQTDFGLTTDFALAFASTGTEPEAMEAIVDALAAAPGTFSTFTTIVEYGDREDSQIAGATSKLATMVQEAGRDATNFAGHDLIEEVESVVVDSGEEAGRASDISDYGDESNGFGQSFAVRALATAGSDETDAAADYLIKQQCDNGAFRINLSADGCGVAGDGDTVSIDTTGLAIEALVVARDADYDGADAAIADAASYLVTVQEDNGSFFDTGAFNSNSTGLAAAALAAAGESAAATKAADWVASIQATSDTSILADDDGAIAYDQAAFDAGRTDGIPAELGDQWRRATAQAVLGVQFATAGATEPEPAEPGPVDSMQLTVSDLSPTQGDTITVTAAGKDADGVSTGDVSDELVLESSVASDTIGGNTVTFNSASPHTITATHVPTGTTASVVVEVSPLASEKPTASSGGVSGGGTTVSNANDTLPAAGSLVEPWQLAAVAALLALGVAMVVAGRRQVAVRSTHRAR